MLKFIFYLVVFFIIGFFYGRITEGTIFDNVIALLISMFTLIFLIEWITSLIKKKSPLKKEAESEVETWDDLMLDVQKEFEKTWDVKYNNNLIQIVNKYNQEELYINGQLVDQKNRSGWYTWLKPYQTLTGVIEENGRKAHVKVKLGGTMSIDCKVYVDGKMFFHDKVKYKFDVSGVKKKD
ncbi:hypothetical protein SM124_15400 [Bacillus sp. 31A1R]|uniref:Uncharacterized protein n=1 Tax=Robertmurraya mangrovi TaxID=3098077 RepID=A0ABU5J116_9BACI|nr:hypothetical protein [Bacillus sp. 31A1R]MDZ5473104.1 hypothetical protein [Bacillus sp. 31A1R]